MGGQIWDAPKGEYDLWTTKILAGKNFGKEFWREINIGAKKMPDMAET